MALVWIEEGALDSTESTRLYWVNNGAFAEGTSSSSAIKTWDGLARASIKTWNELADASVKTWNGLA